MQFTVKKLELKNEMLSSTEVFDAEIDDILYYIIASFNK